MKGLYLLGLALSVGMGACHANLPMEGTEGDAVDGGGRGDIDMGVSPAAQDLAPGPSPDGARSDTRDAPATGAKDSGNASADRAPRNDAVLPNGGLALHWTFDDGSGTTVKDSTGNDLNGSLEVANGGPLPTWAPGMKGDAIRMNRAIDYDDKYQYQWVGLPHEKTRGLLDVGADDDISISVWINREGEIYGDSGCIVSKLLSGVVPGSTNPYVQPPGLRIQLRADVYHHTLAAWISDGKQTLFVGAPRRAETTIAAMSGWHHVVFVFDHRAVENCRWYVDGEDVKAQQLEWYVENDAERTRPGTVPAGSLANNQPFTVGRRSAGNAEAPFNGMIDELRVYKRVLTAAEVRDLYKSP